MELPVISDTMTLMWCHYAIKFPGAYQSYFQIHFPVTPDAGSRIANGKALFSLSFPIAPILLDVVFFVYKRLAPVKVSTVFVRVIFLRAIWELQCISGKSLHTT